MAGYSQGAGSRGEWVRERYQKNWLTGKDPDAGKDWRKEEKGATEDERAGWHHRLHELEFEQTPGVGDRQGGLACCSPWGRKESDTTEQLNNNRKIRNGQSLAQGLQALECLTKESRLYHEHPSKVTERVKICDQRSRCRLYIKMLSRWADKLRGSSAVGILAL